MTKAEFESKIEAIRRSPYSAETADAVGRLLSDHKAWLKSLERRHYAMAACVIIVAAYEGGMSSDEVERVFEWHRLSPPTSEEVDDFFDLIDEDEPEAEADRDSDGLKTYCTACNCFVDQPCHPGPAPDTRPDSAAPTASADRRPAPPAAVKGGPKRRPLTPNDAALKLRVFSDDVPRVAEVLDALILRSEAWANTKYVDWSAYNINASTHVNVRTGIVQHLREAEKHHANDDREGVNRSAAIALLWTLDYLANCLGADFQAGIDTVIPYVDGD